MLFGRTTSFGLASLFLILSAARAETPTQDKQRKEAAPPAVKIRHLAARTDGWSVAETAHFRVHYKEDEDLADRVVEAAERARAAVQRRWFGDTADAWDSRCDLYLQLSASAPGITTTQADGTRVLSRRIDLQADHKDLLSSVLPHEVAHAVLAGQFGDRPVPKWADEGIAMLAEPEARHRKYVRDLDRFREDKKLVLAADLIQSRDYPENQSLGPFYTQSVSVVEFLAQEKGAPVFTTFLRDLAREGAEKALKRYYGWDGDELDRRWRKYAFSKETTRTERDAMR